MLQMMGAIQIENGVRKSVLAEILTNIKQRRAPRPAARPVEAPRANLCWRQNGHVIAAEEEKGNGMVLVHKTVTQSQQLVTLDRPP